MVSPPLHGSQPSFPTFNPVLPRKRKYRNSLVHQNDQRPEQHKRRNDWSAASQTTLPPPAGTPQPHYLPPVSLKPDTDVSRDPSPPETGGSSVFPVRETANVDVAPPEHRDETPTAGGPSTFRMPITVPQTPVGRLLARAPVSTLPTAQTAPHSHPTDTHWTPPRDPPLVSSSGQPSTDLVTGHDADSHLRGSPCSSTPDSMDGSSSSDTRATPRPSPPVVPLPSPRVCTVGSCSGGIQPTATMPRRKRNFSLIEFWPAVQSAPVGHGTGDSKAPRSLVGLPTLTTGRRSLNGIANLSPPVPPVDRTHKRVRHPTSPARTPTTRAASPPRRLQASSIRTPPSRELDPPEMPEPPVHVLTVSPPSSPTLLDTPSSPEVQFVGPPGPPTLEAISPSGDVRLTIRRYVPGDTLVFSTLRFRLDLRVHPRDLYSIPSDGHCGYHSLAVLSHPHYPDPPNTAEREVLRTTLLDSLAKHPDATLRAAALAGQQHPPPRFLPRPHWFRADWLGLISTLPPLGCLALLDERDPDSPNPWYYCTALSGSNTQFEHSWSDLLRLAHSGRLMLHSRDHYHPVTPPPFLTLAIRQCGALLLQQLGGTDLPVPDTTRPTLPLGPPRARRYTSTRALPGGVQLGLSRSALSPEAQWGVFTLKTIPRGTCILEYGGQLRTQAWLDTSGQNLIYVWSDLDAHSTLATSGRQPVIIDANPAFTDS